MCGLAVLGVAMLALVGLGCDDEAASDECQLNAECTGVCVAGQCVDSPDDCHTIGAFVAGTPYTTTGTISELHVAFTPAAKVVACWYGQWDGVPMGVLVRQQGTGWIEEVLTTRTGELLRCGAIGVGSDETVYVLSRSPALVQAREAEGGITEWPLQGIEGDEALGALSIGSSSLTLTPGEGGDLGIALALGVRLEAQALYLAEVRAGVFTVLFNSLGNTDQLGLNVGGTPTLLRWPEGPQAVVDGVLAGRIQGLVPASDPVLSWSVEGSAPKPYQTADGSSRLAYLDVNGKLVLSDLGFAGPQTLLSLDAGLPGPTDGQLPFDLTTASDGRLFVAFTPTAMTGVLSLAAIDSTGALTAPQTLTERLATHLPGGQRFAITTDLCTRPLLAFAGLDEETGAVRLDVVEGR